MKIRVAGEKDREQLVAMRGTLWPEATAEELQNATVPGEVFVAEDDDRLIGFVEVSLRSHADGCETNPVGFLEGWFVEEGVRRRGVGTKLVEAAENWAREQGCREMASDTWIDHELSHRAHEGLGFEVVDRCVHYKKKL
jgi:aminoglycoside 6'-N-acetyltransferase I